MKVVILGTGNAAQVLGRLIHASGHRIVEVAGRDPQKAGVLAAAWDARPVKGFSRLAREADLYLMALSDRAIPSVASRLRLSGGILVHTAGSVSIDALASCGTAHGVLYPLQSLRANLVRLPKIPFLVDANGREALDTLLAFAGSLSGQVRQADDAARLRMHLAAVFTSNFMNHLFALTERYCISEGLDFRLLGPLLSETVSRIQEAPAAGLQTGPAIRGDRPTQALHRQLLRDHPGMQAIYRLMSRSIRDFHGDG